MFNFRKMDKCSEDAYFVIMKAYSSDNKTNLTISNDSFPEYLQSSLEESFEKLKQFGILSSYQVTLRESSVIIVPHEEDYFAEKARYERMNTAMFEKLPSNSETLLQEMLDADNPTKHVLEKFQSPSSEKEQDILHGILRELEMVGLINVFWADNSPYNINLNNSARTYFERKAEYERQQEAAAKSVVNVGTINATGSNVVLGDVLNSTLSIDNSIQKIESEIEEKGGEDKEALHALLEETKELIENIQLSRTIPKNKGFFNRLSDHLQKHGWFYAQIVALLGKAAFEMIGA